MGGRRWQATRRFSDCFAFSPVPPFCLPFPTLPPPFYLSGMRDLPAYYAHWQQRVGRRDRLQALRSSIRNGDAGGGLGQATLRRRVRFRRTAARHYGAGTEDGQAFPFPASWRYILSQPRLASLHPLSPFLILCHATSSLLSRSFCWPAFASSSSSPPYYSQHSPFARPLCRFSRTAPCAPAGAVVTYLPRADVAVNDGTLDRPAFSRCNAC